MVSAAHIGTKEALTYVIQHLNLLPRQDVAVEVPLHVRTRFSGFGDSRDGLGGSAHFLPLHC